VRDLVKPFKTLCDETRLRMLNLLTAGECCVCEVMQALEISQSRASRNLRILYDAGFLKMRKEGLWALYSINEGMVDYVQSLVEAVCKALASNATAKKDIERLRQARRVGLACIEDMKKSNVSQSVTT